MQIDKDAARRFIKAAIGTPRAPAEPATHTRFEGDNEEGPEGETAEVKEAEGAAKVKQDSTPASKSASKRPKMDPFAGYDSPKAGAGATKKKKASKQQSGADGPAPGSPAAAAPPAAASPRADTQEEASPRVSKHQKKKAYAAAKAKKGSTS